MATEQINAQLPNPATGAEDEAGRSGAPRAGAHLFFYVVASAALVIAALYFGRPLLMPLALAGFLAFVLDPLVTRLRRVGVPLPVAVTMVVAFTLAVLAAIGALGAQQVSKISHELPTYQATIQKKLIALRPAADGIGIVGGTTRLVAVIEKEIDAARSAMEPREAKAARATQRVMVEPAPPSPFRQLRDLVSPLLVPLAMAGLVFILLSYMLVQRREISDRLMRLVGGDMHLMATALNDAAQRVSRFLAAQLLVNIGFGVCLGLGLMAIGVPGAPLWGVLAVLLRFVPYLGPLMAMVIPLLLAFAVDPGWSMVAWTFALVLTLELAVNNIVEPLAYSGSTGVSPVAVLLSAGFWGLLWGPIGLVLATPLTVCLAVLGRHLGALRFFDVLLGTDPAFDPPTQLYRRLISGDRDEAIAAASAEADRTGLRRYYSDVGVPMLKLASAWSSRRASARQRHRVLVGAARIVAELRSDHGGSEAADARVVCVGARGEFATLSAQMLAHVLAHEGIPARSLPESAIGADMIDRLALDGVGTLVLCTFHPQPRSHARYVFKHLRRRWPDLHLVLAAWSALDNFRGPDAAQTLGADTLAVTLDEAASRVVASGVAATTSTVDAASATSPSDGLQALMSRAAQQAAEVFGAPLVTAGWRGEDGVRLNASAGRAAAQFRADAWIEDSPWAAVMETGKVVAVADLARSPQWAGAPSAGLNDLPAFVGVPLHDGAKTVVGVLAVHDTQAREIDADDLEVLGRIANWLSAQLREASVRLVRDAASAPSYLLSAPRPAYVPSGSA